MTNNTTKRALISSALALFLCFVMLIGTTFAWFTDEVSSNGNVIQAGELNVELWQHTADGSNEITDSSDPIFGKADSTTANANTANTLWEPGKTQTVYLSIKNAGSLSLKYKVAIEVVDSEKNLHEVMEYIITPDATVDAPVAKSDLNWANGLPVDLGINIASEDVSLPVGSEHFFALSVHMDEYANNDYQLGNVVFNIKILAAQLSDEVDSYDNLYDALATYGMPLADVEKDTSETVSATRGIGGNAEEMDLVTSYIFRTTETKEQAELNPQKLYHADFVVSVNKDIPADAIGLVGYYEAFCEDYNDGHWVAITGNAGEVIADGTQLRLLEILMGGSINYVELCEWIPEFKCGIAILDDTADLSGATITVELRLYEVPAKGDCAEGGGCNHPYIECETGDYISIGSWDYAFN